MFLSATPENHCMLKVHISHLFMAPKSHSNTFSRYWDKLNKEYHASGTMYTCFQLGERNVGGRVIGLHNGTISVWNFTFWQGVFKNHRTNTKLVWSECKYIFSCWVQWWQKKNSNSFNKVCRFYLKSVFTRHLHGDGYHGYRRDFPNIHDQLRNVCICLFVFCFFCTKSVHSPVQTL